MLPLYMFDNELDVPHSGTWYDRRSVLKCGNCWYDECVVEQCCEVRICVEMISWKWAWMWVLNV